jgi:ring-1,2-phenylacetyl-CoA epoxidase subunit PaaD
VVRRSATGVVSTSSTTRETGSTSEQTGATAGAAAATAKARALVAAVVDPEIPVLTIDDLGILRDVTVGDGGAVEVTITPTYSGCPAMEAITADVTAALADGGFTDVAVRSVLAPAWTTDWMSDAGKAKLLAYGIAPPQARSGTQPVLLALTLRCPQCGSPDTRELSRFGSTACKSLWVCNACREPFDHFKAI